MLDHFGINVIDLAATAAFYDAVLGPLGSSRQMEVGRAIGYGRDGKPTFWVSDFADALSNRECHIAFAAASRGQVDAFFDAAVAMGAEVLHSPRLWPEYHESYYGAFVRDPDGNNVEAVCHTG